MTAANAVLAAAGIGCAVAAMIALAGCSSREPAARQTTAPATTAAGSTFPNDEESTLLAHVPPQIAPSCERADPVRESLASIFCTPPSSAVAVSYHLFAGLSAARRWYANQITFWHSERNTGSCSTSTFTGEFRYDVGQRSRGRVLCVLDNGTPRIEWIDTRVGIGAEAFRSDSRGDLLWRTWKCCLRTLR